ncbi:hypothetical protein [Streptomyces hydrogenans]|jgi:hypothetical protein
MPIDAYAFALLMVLGLAIGAATAVSITATLRPERTDRSDDRA